MTHRVVSAFPVLPGKEQQVREFARELAARGAETEAFYTQFGVSHASWHLQQTVAGPWVVSLTEITRVPISAAAQQYKASERPFDRWFKNQVRDLTGVDPDEFPLGPASECIFSWPEASSR